MITLLRAPTTSHASGACSCGARSRASSSWGKQIGLLEEAGEADRFLFGLEESCGYLKGSYVRDKDGVEALALVCEMMADYRARGTDLVEALEDLGRRVGQAGKQLTISFEGADGSERMTGLMTSLCPEVPEVVAGLRVESIVDYSNGAPMLVVNPLSGDPEQTLLPTDMFEWHLEGGSRVLVRPSGTEPKLKAYCFAKGASEGGVEAAVANLSDGTRDLLAYALCR